MSQSAVTHSNLGPEPVEAPRRRGSPTPGQSTKLRLLDAAERLFAERGFEGASMRALTQAAGTSVSAANYHFGSKEALLRAVLQRRIEPVNRERLRRLDAFEAAAQRAGRRIELEEVLDAFLRPGFDLQAEEPDVRGGLRQVAARLYADPPEVVAALKRELFAEVVERFVGALAAALPDRERDELAVAFQFTVGVMVHVMSGHLESAPGIASEDADAFAARPTLAAMVAYTAAGLRARPSGTHRAPAGAST